MIKIVLLFSENNVMRIQCSAKSPLAIISNSPLEFSKLKLFPDNVPWCRMLPENKQILDMVELSPSSLTPPIMSVSSPISSPCMWL